MILGLSIACDARTTTRILSPYFATLYGVNVPSAAPTNPVNGLTKDVAALLLTVYTAVKSARTFFICMLYAPETNFCPETAI